MKRDSHEVMSVLKKMIEKKKNLVRINNQAEFDKAFSNASVEPAVLETKELLTALGNLDKEYNRIQEARQELHNKVQSKLGKLLGKVIYFNPTDQMEKAVTGYIEEKAMTLLANNPKLKEEFDALAELEENLPMMLIVASSPKEVRELVLEVSKKLGFS